MLLLLALLAAVPGPMDAAPDPFDAVTDPVDAVQPVPEAVERSVVKVQAYRAGHDWANPWRMHSVRSGVGSGFYIGEGRILTNAHVVRDARQVIVTRYQVADPFIATVEVAGHDADLALLRVEDPAFSEGLEALPFGDLPRARTTVTTYGYPMGGNAISSTAGIVSRIELRTYVHTGYDTQLAVQTDAAINPGNSGGPVVQDGRVVGVAFQGARALQNVGYFIPVPVVRRFLDDAATGTYDGFPDAGLHTVPLFSPAARRERGLPAGRTGVLVDQVATGGTADGALARGDVLLAVDGIPVEIDGTIPLGDTRVSYKHLIGMKLLGEPVHFEVLRDGEILEVTAAARRMARSDRHRRRYDVAPRYLVYAGLVFMPLETEVLTTLYGNWRGGAPRELVWHHLFQPWEDGAAAEKERVVLVRVLRHPVNAELHLPRGGRGLLLARVNGREIEKLEDVAAALEAGDGAFHAFEFEPMNHLEVLPRVDADAAHGEILETYGIPRDRSVDR